MTQKSLTNIQIGSWCAFWFLVGVLGTIMVFKRGTKTENATTVFYAEALEEEVHP